jgi:hypothetical protein
MYALGIDLGTTFTGAATWRNGHAEVASLGSRAAVIPSVVLLREDETVLTGETASRRGLSEPHRVSREFKRRLGDPTPILLAGTPYSAEALMAALLRSVVSDVTQREGGPPSRLCISHPANWGPYKKDLLGQAVRMADLPLAPAGPGAGQPVVFTTEPEAAAVFYANQQRVEPGAIVAVYDLGGGTFDAAVLRKTAAGFEILGQPEGIERLGGVDFDAAVFNHVSRALGGKLTELNEDDPGAVAAVGRLREECIEAKEALSSDTDVSIPVLLPNLSTEIRLTRAELEAMVRPALHNTIEALRRALRSANVTPEQLHSVLLVGGSSRMPLVAQLVGAELGRPVAVDAHPKHAIALGAAWLASGTEASQPAAAAPLPVSGPPVSPLVSTPVSPTPVGLPATVAAAPLAAAAATPRYTYTGSAAVPPQGDARTMVDTRPRRADPPPVTTSRSEPVPPPRPPAPPRSPDGSPWRRPLLIGVVVAVLLALTGAGVAYAMRGDPDEQAGPDGDPSTATPTGSGESAEPAPELPADEQCTDAIMSNDRWACITGASFDGTTLRIEYDVDWGGEVPNKTNGYHLHLYGGDGTDPPADVMGAQAPQGQRGSWMIEDLPSPLEYSNGEDILDMVSGQEKVCARIASSDHHLVPSSDGAFGTGNCWPIER